MIRSQRGEIKEVIEVNYIKKQTWVDNLQFLYAEQNEVEDSAPTPEIVTNGKLNI